METFVAAYLIVWGGILWYVLRLGAKQRQLFKEIETLRQLESQAPESLDEPTSRAA